MIKVVKGNRELMIHESEIATYEGLGYSRLGKDGKLVPKKVKKTEQEEALEKEIAALKKENAELSKKLAEKEKSANDTSKKGTGGNE